MDRTENTVMAEGPWAPAMKRSHTYAIQTVKQLPPTIVDSDGLEYLSLLLSLGGREKSVKIPDNGECVLGRVEENLGVGTRQVATELTVVQMTIWRVLHQQLCP
jgi:hypothetical protein